MIKHVIHVDSDWEGDVKIRKSTLGYAFYIGSKVFFVIKEMIGGFLVNSRSWVYYNC